MEKHLLTGEAKERALTGQKVVGRFFKDAVLSETLKELERVSDVIVFISEQKGNCDIDSAIEIIEYARAYAANTKDW